jgi:hypothetical protein
MNRATLLEPGLWRSPRPTGMELRSWTPALATLVDLEPVRYETAEASLAETLGIHEFSIPMSSIWPPRFDDVLMAAALMANPSQRPLCVHCKHGRSRTGVVVAFWRVRFCRWQPELAIAEMKAAGFHKRYWYWMRDIRRLLEWARGAP